MVGADQLPEERGLARTGRTNQHHAGVTVVGPGKPDERIPQVARTDDAGLDVVEESSYGDGPAPEDDGGGPTPSTVDGRTHPLIAP